ncbi:hypothetical protein C8Q74DRAFT_321490 [Fomes fomentarius]|nr:hypothetical protein C8Q74DRAFT_321490 [Fomes fomentarius]
MLRNVVAVRQRCHLRWRRRTSIRRQKRYYAIINSGIWALLVLYFSVLAPTLTTERRSVVTLAAIFFFDLFDFFLIHGLSTCLRPALHIWLPATSTCQGAKSDPSMSIFVWGASHGFVQVSAYQFGSSSRVREADDAPAVTPCWRILDVLNNMRSSLLCLAFVQQSTLTHSGAPHSPRTRC